MAVIIVSKAVRYEHYMAVNIYMAVMFISDTTHFLTII